VCSIRCYGNHAEKCGGPDDFVSVYIGMKIHLSCVHFTYNKRMQKQQQNIRNIYVSMNFYGMIVRIKLIITLSAYCVTICSNEQCGIISFLKGVACVENVKLLVSGGR